MFNAKADLSLRGNPFQKGNLLKSSKKALAVLASAVLAAIGIVGCADSKPAEEASETEVIEETDGDEVVEEEEVEEVEEVSNEGAEVEAVLTTAEDYTDAFLNMIMGGDKDAEAAYEASDGDPEAFFDKLAIAKYITFENLTPEEAYEFKAHYYYMAVMGLFEYGGMEGLKVTYPEDAVSVDGDKAKVDTTNGVATFDDDGEEVEEDVGELELGTLELILEGGEWKVDARNIAEFWEMDLEPEE